MVFVDSQVLCLISLLNCNERVGYHLRNQQNKEVSNFFTRKRP